MATLIEHAGHTHGRELCTATKPFYGSHSEDHFIVVSTDTVDGSMTSNSLCGDCAKGFLEFMASDQGHEITVEGTSAIIHTEAVPDLLED